MFQNFTVLSQDPLINVCSSYKSNEFKYNGPVWPVKLKHFEMAFLKIKPSVSVKVNVYIFVLLCNIVETKNLLLFKGLWQIWKNEIDMC